MSTNDQGEIHAEHGKKPHLPPRNLEDCEPGATRQEVLGLIDKVVKAPKPSRKHTEPPVPTL